MSDIMQFEESLYTIDDLTINLFGELERGLSPKCIIPQIMLRGVANLMK